MVKNVIFIKKKHLIEYSHHSISFIPSIS